MSDRGFRGAHNDHSLSIRPKEEARKNRASLLESRSRSAARLPALPRCADKTHRANWFRPVRGPFYLEELDADWRNEYRKCERCKREYRPQREAQSYCTPMCRRAAAYGRERFAARTKGTRKRRLEASERRMVSLVPNSLA